MSIKGAQIRDETIETNDIKDNTIEGQDVNPTGSFRMGTVAIGSAADSSAALTITSTTQGLLHPRMTPTQRDAVGSPASGLLIWDSTNNELAIYNGSGWINATGSSAPSAGADLSSAGLFGQSSYSSGGDSGFASAMDACSAAGSSSGTSQTWYKSADGSQVYSDSAGNTAVSLSSAGYFWLSNGGSLYRFYITTSGAVYDRNVGGSPTNLSDTSGAVSCA